MKGTSYKTIVSVDWFQTRKGRTWKYSKKEQYLPCTLLSIVTKRVEVLHCVLFNRKSWINILPWHRYYKSLLKDNYLTLSPPVAWTTGTVPYCIAYSWLRPQGSNLDGINNISQLYKKGDISTSNINFIFIYKMTSEFFGNGLFVYPAVIRWETGTLNPTHPRNLSLKVDSVDLIQASSSGSPDPSMTYIK